MGCFPEHAKVATSSGKRSIQNFHVGDELLHPHGTKELASTTVEEIFESNEELIGLVTTHGATLTTADQLFRCYDGKDRPTQDLMSQFIGYLKDDKELVYVKVVAIIPKNQRAKVFHFRVGEPNLYFVDNFLVHNKGGGGGSSTTSSGLPAWLEPYAKAFIGSYYQRAFGQPFQEGATPNPIARPAGPPQPGRFIRVPAATAQRMGLRPVG